MVAAPIWISFLFILCTVYAITLFHYSNNKPTKITLLIIVWSIIQAILAYNEFYLDFESTPPRFAFVLLPTTLLIIFSLLPKQRKNIIENRNLKVSTWLHTLRLPVEIVLHQLFIYGFIPQLMTYDGRNFDIIMGITAPIIGLLLIKNFLPKKALLTWNIIGTFLICFILTNGILSAELPFQQFAFDQPNRGIAYFPFILLPATVVPLVLWTHITDIFKIVQDLKSS